MDFRLLGPVEARVDGVPLAAIGPKQRALLALLLLNVNELVPHASLVDGLWGDHPPETAAKALQVYVSQLRRVLGRELILTRPGGYRLVVPPDAVDLLRFEELVAEARASAPAAAAPKLRTALALWRGPALADVADAAFARTETGRLEELRLAAAEELVDVELALGHDGALVPELERRVANNPLRERPRGQLMLALYRSGRQAEALECYQAGRRVLVDELGIEPGRQLRELHHAILQQDTALEAEVAIEADDEPETDVREPPPGLVAREARKTVTAICVGLTSWAGEGEPLDPEALRLVTNRAFGEIKAAVERHGGTVETVAVDAISAIFGLPTLHEDDAVRAVRGAAELQGRVASLAGQLHGERGISLVFRVGVSTGEVVTGGDAAAQMRATGVPLAVSSRLAQMGEGGEIHVDDQTFRLARDAMVVEDVSVGSRSIYRLVSLVADVPRHASRLVSPMVGRDREVRRLVDAFEQAVGDRSCQLFTVLGSAGVGKSRLIREFVVGLSGRALVVRGRCLPYGEGITFWPLLEAVKEAVGLDDEDSSADALAKLIRALGEEPDAEVAAQRIGELIGLADVRGVVETGAASVLSLLHALARTEPLVVVFDDIHWAEPTFLDLIEYVADWARDAPILLVCLARPELLDVRSGWGGGKLNATSALLEPLSDEECSLLIENLIGEAGFPDEMARKIADAAEGNPLFVEEMLSMLIDDGVLVRQNGRWAATGDDPVPVPPTIQALLAARLDRLDADERATIERAAVHGKLLYEDAIADFAPDRLSARVADSLAALVRKDLIRPGRASLGGRMYRFRHLLIRDAAYDSIPKDARARMHEHFAYWLERAAGERATEYDEIVGYHLEQAYRYRAELGPVDETTRALARSAADRLGRAGRRAFARSDGSAGVNLISRAVSLLPPEDPRRVDLVPSVRFVQGMSSDMTWAERLLTEAVEAAATSGDRRLAAHALVQRGLLRLFTVAEVTPEELLDAADRSIAVFADSSDELGLARAWRLKAQAHYLARRAGRCAEASERALEHSQRAGDRFEEREIIEWLLLALQLGPTPAAEAAQRCERLLVETAGDTALQAQITGASAWLVAMLGQTSAAEELVMRSREIMANADEWSWPVSFSCGYHYLWQRDPIAAELQLRPGYETLKQLGGSHFSSFSHLLAHAVYLQGRHAEAEQLTRECEEASRPNDVLSHILWRSTRAKVLARRGEHGAAEHLARDAVAFASESDFTLAHAESLMDLAEVLELGSRQDEAVVPLRQAILLCEEKGSLPAVELARSRVEELSS